MTIHVPVFVIWTYGVLVNTFAILGFAIISALVIDHFLDRY